MPYKDREKRLEYTRKWKEERDYDRKYSEEHKEQIQQYQREYQKKNYNTEKNTESCRAWAEKNKETRQEYLRRWREEHPNYCRDNSREHRDGGQRQDIIKKLKTPIFCYFCKEEITRLEGCDADSILIHSLDGNHENWNPENKVPIHFGCHTSLHFKIGKVTILVTQ